jgi:mannose-6-phosphate isomerase
MNELYPFKFEPILKDKIWGGTRLREVLDKTAASPNCGESWEISAVQDNISVVANGYLAGNELQELIEVYMGDLVGDRIYEEFGIEFPLLVKFIDANDKLSIQVHPGDELAKQRHQAFGKTEMWYIVESEPGAWLISGFNRELDKQAYLEHLQNKTLPDILNFEETAPGNVFFVPAGRVHAVGPGILLAEIQQTSDITYRIYDWDRVDDQGKGRELHTELALEAIDYRHYDSYRTVYEPSINQTSQVADCRYFTTNVLQFDRQVEKDFNFIDSFVIYMCLEGNYELRYADKETMNVTGGETVLVPAVIKNIELVPRGTSKILEVYIKR